MPNPAKTETNRLPGANTARVQRQTQRNMCGPDTNSIKQTRNKRGSSFGRFCLSSLLQKLGNKSEQPAPAVSDTASHSRSRPPLVILRTRQQQQRRQQGEALCVLPGSRSTFATRKTHTEERIGKNALFRSDSVDSPQSSGGALSRDAACRETSSPQLG